MFTPEASYRAAEIGPSSMPAGRSRWEQALADSTLPQAIVINPAPAPANSSEPKKPKEKMSFFKRMFAKASNEQVTFNRTHPYDSEIMVLPASLAIREIELQSSTYWGK